MSVDSFQDNNTTAETPAGDLFGRATGGGAYPKVDEMEGLLLLIRPVRIESVPNRFDTDGSKPTQDRATADVIVFDEDSDRYTVHTEMFLSQIALLNACRGALKPGSKPMVLGRLVKLPTKATAEKFKIETAEEFTAARSEWLRKGGKGTEPKHVWVMAEYSAVDAEKARKYFSDQDRFG